MVNKGQTILEFVIILLALTAIGFGLWRVVPSLQNVQNNAATALSKD